VQKVQQYTAQTSLHSH